MGDPRSGRSGSGSGPRADGQTVRLGDLRKAAIVESAPDCIITADADGCITEFNPAAERTFGYRRDDVLGRRLVDVILPPSRREMHGDGLARHLANERALVLGTPMETTAVRVDQRELTVELTVKRTELDGQLCVIVYVRDVTARRQADEELRRHAAYLAEGHRLTRAGLWVWNPGTDAGFASEETHRLFGLSPGDPARATLADFLPRVHAADRQVLNAALERARREHAAFEVRFRVVHPDGALRYLSTRGHPMSASGAAQDEPREFVGTVVDVTDRRRAEEEQVRHAREVALRADVSGALARVDTLRGMLQGCADALVTHLDAAFARIWTLRRGADVLDLQASAGAYTRLDGRYAHVRVGELKIGLIARERVPYLTNDVLGDPRIENKEWARREGMVAFAGYPLVVEERVVGVMAVFARHTLAPQTLDALTSISAAVAQGVERKRSEEELRRSEAYLAEGQQLSHTGSWAWNLVTGELFFSAEWYRIYGFDPAGPAPAYDAVLARAHPDDVAGVDTALKDAFQAGTELRLLTRILVPGQPMKWVQTYGHPVHDVDGALVEFRGTVIDVTHEVHANRRRRRAIKARYAAVLAERTRIARDMHDGLLQDLTGIALQLRALLPHVRAAPETAALASILELTERTGQEARRAVLGMRTRASVDATLADLVHAVETAAQRAAAHGSAALSVTVKGRARPVHADVCDAVAAIVHEAVTNARRHAGARTVKLSLVFQRARLRLAVSDDGRGFPLPGDDEAGHYGLVGMRERATGLGASFNLRSRPGAGTTIRLDVPYGR